MGLVMLPVLAFAAGRPPVALLLEATGIDGTGLETYSEVRSGDRIALAEDGQVEFLHYATCQTVVVRGGELSFSDERYTVRQGKVVDAKRAPCPSQAVAQAETQVAGVVLRSVPLQMEPQASFLLVGGWQGKISSVAIKKDGKVLLQQAVRDARVVWPAGSPPLEVGGPYTLELGGASPLTTQFQVKRSAGLAVVRVE